MLESLILATAILTTPRRVPVTPGTVNLVFFVSPDTTSIQLHTGSVTYNYPASMYCSPVLGMLRCTPQIHDLSGLYTTRAGTGAFWSPWEWESPVTCVEAPPGCVLGSCPCTAWRMEGPGYCNTTATCNPQLPPVPNLTGCSPGGSPNCP